MKFPKILKNKYLIALCIFLVYFLFLDDIDVFTLYSQIKTKNKLQEQNKAMKAQLMASKRSIGKMKDIHFIEHYARSKKYFKSDDEEIFVIIPKTSH